MIAFIDDHRGEHGVGPICKVLPIARLLRETGTLLTKKAKSKIATLPSVGEGGRVFYLCSI